MTVQSPRQPRRLFRGAAVVLLLTMTVSCGGEKPQPPLSLPIRLTRVLFVDAGASGASQDGSLANPYKRIQAAVEVVNASVGEVLVEVPIWGGGGVRPLPPSLAEQVPEVPESPTWGRIVAVSGRWWIVAQG